MRRALLLFVPLVLLAAACGDSDESGASAEDWCDLAREVEALDFESVDPTDPEALRTFFDDAGAVMGRIRASAPDEISDAANTFADQFEALTDAVREADFNFFDADLSAIEDIESSGDAIEAYNERECGIESDSDDTDDEDSDDGDFDPSAGSVREQLAAQFVQQGFSEDEANCLAESLDPAMLQDGDQSAVLEIFDACDIDIARLAELFG